MSDCRLSYKSLTLLNQRKLLILPPTFHVKWALFWGTFFEYLVIIQLIHVVVVLWIFEVYRMVCQYFDAEFLFYWLATIHQNHFAILTRIHFIILYIRIYTFLIPFNNLLSHFLLNSKNITYLFIYLINIKIKWFKFYISG